MIDIISKCKTISAFQFCRINPESETYVGPIKNAKPESLKNYLYKVEMLGERMK